MWAALLTVAAFSLLISSAFAAYATYPFISLEAATALKKAPLDYP
jgi:hypothetical protein